MHAKAERLLERELQSAPHASDTSHYGDRIEIRRLWACATDPEEMGFYAASQVFAVERTVIPVNSTQKESCNIIYNVASAMPCGDSETNGELLLKAYRGHWGIETGCHMPRDTTCGEDKSPIKNHNAARALATMKMLGIFLSNIGAHKPQTDRDRCLPEFHRSCAINGIDRAIGWFTRKYSPLKA